MHGVALCTATESHESLTLSTRPRISRYCKYFLMVHLLQRKYFLIIIFDSIVVSHEQKMNRKQINLHMESIDIVLYSNNCSLQSTSLEGQSLRREVSIVISIQLDSQCSA